MISAVVLTKNEKKNVKDCLESLKWCDEIIVVDDYSEDKTAEIASHLGARAYKRHLVGDFARQRNFGLEKAKGKWVLFVDADERISTPLAAEIQYKVSCPAGRRASVKYKGFYLKRRDWFGGRWLKHGETGRVKLLRLGRKGAGEWRRQVHEVWEIKGKIGSIEIPILHYPHPTVSDFLRQINFYSTLHTEALLKEKVKPSLWRIIFYPLGKFFQNYFFRLGFLDGEPGLIVALMMSLHSFLAQSKLYYIVGEASLKWEK